MQSGVVKNVNLFLNRSTFISLHFPFEDAADDETGVAVVAASGMAAMSFIHPCDSILDQAMSINIFRYMFSF
jgi:hypothetical protein